MVLLQQVFTLHVDICGTSLVGVIHNKGQRVTKLRFGGHFSVLLESADLREGG